MLASNLFMLVSRTNSRSYEVVEFKGLLTHISNL
jgi:hypothetical protein